MSLYWQKVTGFGMTVTAEGIEMEQLARVLSGLECDHF